MLLLRSLLFDIFFYIFTTCYVVILFPIILLSPYHMAFSIYKLWAKVIIWVLEKTVRIKIVIHGKKNIPDKPHIIAIQHQSALDTIIPPLIFNNFALALKKELLLIPFLGAYLYKLNAIFLNRKKGFSSLKNLLKKAEKQKNLGKNILIYPEGTRVKINTPSAIQSGVIALYNHLKCPILPVSLNTGFFWPRKGFLKKSGIVHVVIHPIISENMQKDTVKQIIENTYNSRN